MSEGQHLHQDDCPGALVILTALFGHRLGSAEEIGFKLTEVGAFVDWDRLVRSWLSSTETAAVHIARGCAIAERHGGFGPTLQWPVFAAITGVCQ